MGNFKIFAAILLTALTTSPAFAVSTCNGTGLVSNLAVQAFVPQLGAGRQIDPYSPMSAIALNEDLVAVAYAVIQTPLKTQNTVYELRASFIQPSTGLSVRPDLILSGTKSVATTMTRTPNGFAFAYNDYPANYAGINSTVSSPTPSLYLLEVDLSGNILLNQYVMGGQNNLTNGAEVPETGQLIWTGSYYALYVSEQGNLGSNPPNYHQWDLLKYLDAKGTQIAAPLTRNCSHSVGRALAWDGQNLAAVCSGDGAPFGIFFASSSSFFKPNGLFTWASSATGGLGFSSLYMSMGNAVPAQGGFLIGHSGWGVNDVKISDLHLERVDPSGNVLELIQPFPEPYTGFQDNSHYKLDIRLSGFENGFITGWTYKPGEYYGSSTYEKFFVARLDAMGHAVGAPEQLPENARFRHLPEFMIREQFFKFPTSGDIAWVNTPLIENANNFSGATKINVARIKACGPPAPSTVCTTSPPTVTLSPRSQIGGAGDSINYLVSVKNNDSATCPATNFNLALPAPFLPSGFSGSFSVNALNLSPGASGSATLMIQSAASTPPVNNGSYDGTSDAGKYIFAVSATDPLSITHAGFASATYVVNPPLCIARPPTITLSLSPSSLQNMNYMTFTLTNNDSPTCFGTMFYPKAVLPAGFDWFMFNAVLPLGPGQSVSRTCQVGWSTSTPPGTYNLKFNVHDILGTGNHEASAVATVIVSGTTPSPSPSPTPTQPADTSAPSVSITSPLNGASVLHGSTVTITALASDNVGVTGVDFLIYNSGGSLISQCLNTQAPYSCNWKVPRKTGKSYTIKAQAKDAAGNVGQASPVMVKSN